MPYRRKTYTRRPKKSYKGRKRFSKKKFYKPNNRNQLTQRAPLAAKLLRIKLPWVKTFAEDIEANTAQSYAFQGNGIVPYCGSGSNNIPSAGDNIPAGALEYSSLYDKYFINGSSLKVEILNTNAGAYDISPTLRAVLLAIPFTAGVVGQSSNNDSFSANVTQLNTYTYEQLLAWPYAKFRMIGSNTGGASRITMKMFRKTKSMVGVKDIRDNSELSGYLMDGTLLNQEGDLTFNPNNGFLYYLRIFNSNTVINAHVELTVRMSLYCTLTHREFNPIQRLQSP